MMQSLLLLLVFILIFSDFTYSAILKTPMTNNYPQIAVLGCDSNKANLYYDIQRQVWVEHLVSSCVNTEKSILNFCQQAYPSLRIGNIIRLDTVLRFDNWCELITPMDGNIPRCKIESPIEELVQPYRCLHTNSKREEVSLPTDDCIKSSRTSNGECLHSDKWQQIAVLDCDNRTMLLNSSMKPLQWCGLAKFRGVDFICCPLKDIEAKKSNENDYQTSLDEQDDIALAEDDPIRELIIAPSTSTVETHRRIIAMSLSSREPNWMEDYRRWNNDTGYFADDEDTSDDQDEIKLSSTKKSHLTINEHERFTKAKDEFKRKYKDQMEDLKSRWRKRHNEIQVIANLDANETQQEYEKSEIEFRQEYDTLKQTANQERNRINELHENNLDQALDIAKDATNQKLIAAWNEKPFKTEKIQEALYNYLHVLLRDRIHLVNRYERLYAVDPDQAKHKRVSIHERLRSIANRINGALSQLRRNSKVQSKIQARINKLLTDYNDVNQAAEKLLFEYVGSSTTKNRVLPLGRDEKNIYPFSSTSSKQLDENNNNKEYDYETDDDYEDDDDKETKTISTTTGSVDTGDSDWDVDTDATFNVKIEPNNNEQLFDDNRPVVEIKQLTPRNFFITYLPYILGSVLILCIIIGLVIFCFVIQQRRKYRHGGKYQKNYVFTEIDSHTPEEKALHALQLNGYENPTYKFFESQTAKC